MFVCSDTDSFGVSASVHWTKKSKLGAGAYGEVFLGHDRDTGRNVAVKVLLNHGPLSETSKVQRSMFRISFIYRNKCKKTFCFITTCKAHRS